MTGGPMRLLFVSSVWLFIALNAYEMLVHIVRADRIIGAFPGGYDLRVFIAPFLLVAAELFLWFRMFRWSRPPARIFAGLVGGYILLMIIFVNLIIADLYDRELPVWMMWLYAGAGAGHLAYALLGSERRP